MELRRTLGYGLYLLLVGMAFFFLSGWIGLADAHGEGADSPNEWQHLNRVADESYFLATQGEYEAVQKVLTNLSEHVQRLDRYALLDEPNQMDLIIDSVEQAKQSVGAEEINPREVRQNILRMKLAIDALAHEGQPLWVNYYPVMAAGMDQLHSYLEDEKRDLFFRKLNQLASDYEFIRPSLILGDSNLPVKELDAQLSFLFNHHGELWNSREQTGRLLQGIDQTIRHVFSQERNIAMQSLLWVMIIMGTLIGSVLTYVAWKKYKGERKEETVRWKRDYD